MPRFPQFEQKYQLLSLHEQHKEICRRLVLGEGVESIATSLDITPMTVGNVRNSAIAKGYMAALTHGRNEAVSLVHEEIVAMAPAALSAVYEIMMSPVEKGSVRLTAANGILDRAGLTPIRKLAVHTSNDKLSEEEKEAIKQRAREQTRRRGQLVDIVVTPTPSEV